MKKTKVKKDKILLFIPVYNCEKQVVRVLKQLKPMHEEYIAEVVVVNNRSTDNTEKAVEDFLKSSKINIPVNLLRNDGNYNLGGSHKVAFKYAVKNKFDYIVVLHGDDQGRINDIIPVIERGDHKNNDAMLGSRFMKDSVLGGYSKFRTFGNRVYNTIFTIFLGKRIKDLGSGLNMYSTKILEDEFFFKFRDNLTFNCYMLEAHKEYKHKIKFFPISWREEDQVSNVKMFSQAMTTLNMLFSYFFGRRKFITSELRDTKIEDYTSQIIYSHKGDK